MRGLCDRLSGDFDQFSSYLQSRTKRFHPPSPDPGPEDGNDGDDSNVSDQPQYHHSLGSSLGRVIQANGYRLVENETGEVKKAAKGDHAVALKVLCASTQGDGKLELLTSLQSKDSRNHVIEVIEVIHSVDNMEYVVAMPWELPLNRFLASPPDSTKSLGIQLVEGVSFLHEHNIAHLDLKPENFVCRLAAAAPSRSPRLSIIDFGTSVRVKDAETEVQGYRGTPNWTAPEVGEASGPATRYSAIRADRWSCGLMLRYLMRSCSGPEPTFEAACEQLLKSDPKERPSIEDVNNYLQVQRSPLERIERSGRANGISKTLVHMNAGGYVVLFSVCVPSLRDIYRINKETR